MAVATANDERLLIGGEWVEAGDGERFDVTDPATGEVVGSVPNAGEADVEARHRRRRCGARWVEVAGCDRARAESCAAPRT